MIFMNTRLSECSVTQPNESSPWAAAQVTNMPFVVDRFEEKQSSASPFRKTSCNVVMYLLK